MMIPVTGSITLDPKIKLTLLPTGTHQHGVKSKLGRFGRRDSRRGQRHCSTPLVDDRKMRRPRIERDVENGTIILCRVCLVLFPNQSSVSISVLSSHERKRNSLTSVIIRATSRPYSLV